MLLQEVLEEKKAQILKEANPHLIKFSVEDIEALMDVDQLRFFKLVNNPPRDFKRASDVWSCSRMVAEDDGLYRVLEFCVLKNKILEQPVYKVFEFLKR